MKNKKDITHDQTTAVLQLERCLDALPLEESQPSVQSKPAASSSDDTSAAFGSRDRHYRIQEEMKDKEDLMTGSKDVEMECNERNASMEDKDEESAGNESKSMVDEDDKTESNDQSRSEDDKDMSGGDGNMIPDPAPEDHQDHH